MAVAAAAVAAVAAATAVKAAALIKSAATGLEYAGDGERNKAGTVGDSGAVRMIGETGRGVNGGRIRVR
jgi:hypothetical protein